MPVADRPTRILIPKMHAQLSTATAFAERRIIHEAIRSGQLAYLRFGAKATPTGTAFTTGSPSWWPLNEASGTRNDGYGTNHLTDNNTVTQAAGAKIGNAAQFTAANNEYLSRASNATLQYSGSFTFGDWAYFDTVPGYQLLGSKDDGVAREWLAALNPSSNIEFQVPGGATYTNPAAISAATWYFVVVWFDAVGLTANIQVNNGTVASAAASAPTAGAAPFELGRYGGGLHHNGRMDEPFFIKRVLSASERAWLYNGGVGRSLDEAKAHLDTDFQVTFDVLRGDTSIVQIPLVLDQTATAYRSIDGINRLLNRTYSAGDIFETAITVSGSVGTQALGAFIHLGFEE